jgi:hypothetical protein
MAIDYSASIGGGSIRLLNDGGGINGLQPWRPAALPAATTGGGVRLL